MTLTAHSLYADPADTQRHVCPLCGMAFEDQRLHNEWHIEQWRKRLHARRSAPSCAGEREAEVMP